MRSNPQLTADGVEGVRGFRRCTAGLQDLIERGCAEAFEGCLIFLQAVLLGHENAYDRASQRRKPWRR
jgi:hypothetical protein